MKQILFVCVHNSGRSQMAEAMLNHKAREAGVEIRGASAGTMPTDRINPAAAQAMQEIGISMDGQRSKLLTQAMVDESELVVTMGCGVDAAACPARIYISEDWGLDDPAGQPVEVVRVIRDQIAARVEAMLKEIK
jgi:arsenate reductase